MMPVSPAPPLVVRKKTHTRRCVICGRRYFSYGHNANPVASGRCCDECNRVHVRPAKVREMREDMEFAERLLSEPERRR